MIRRISALFLLTAAGLLALSWSPTAGAQDAEIAPFPGLVVLTDGTSKYPLGLYLEILEDPDGQLAIQQVSAPAYGARFVPSQDKIPNFGYTDSAYWVRFRVRNSTTEAQDWRLELGFANMQHVALYTPLAQAGSATSGFATKRTGTFYPFSTRDVAFHQIVFKLSLPVQAEEIYYLRFQNSASMTLPLTLWSADAFAQASRSDMLYWGIFYGMLLIMLGHSAILFLSLRDRNYLYYAFFLAAFVLFQASFSGHAQQFLWPNQVAWNRFAVLSFTTAIPITALLFTASFLELESRAPFLNGASVVLLTVYGLILLLTPFVPYRLIIQPIAILLIVSFGLMLVSGFVLWWRRGYRPARYYLLSWMAFLVAAIVMALTRSGFAPSSALTEQSYLVGIVLTVLLLTLALAERITLLRAQAQQANRELRESESRLQQYLEAMPVGVTVRDAESRLQYMNRRARQLRYRSDDLSGGAPGLDSTLTESLTDTALYVRGTEQAYPLERLPPARALLGETTGIDDVEMERDGDRIPLEIWSSPVLDDQGRVKYAVSAFRDISRRVAAESRLRTQLEVEKALAGVSTRFVQASDLDQAISETLAEIGLLLGFHRLFLVRIRTERGTMGITHEWYAAGCSPLRPELQDVSVAGAPWLLGELQSGDILYVEDPSDLPLEAEQERKFIEEHPNGRRCVLPIWVGAELRGFLACRGPAAAPPRLENEVQILETVAGMLSGALQQIQVLETLEKRVADRTRELGTLYQVTTVTSTAQPLEVTLHSALEVVLATLDAPMGAIHLRQDRGSPLRLVAHQGLTSQAIDELSAPLPQEIWWEQVLAEQRPLVLSRDPCAQPTELPWACLAEVAVYLGIPIRVAGETLGVLSVFGQSGDELMAEETALLTTIADQLGVAVESDQLRASAEEARLMEERGRLARDLHDAVTQSLYSVTLFARAAREMLQGGSTDRVDHYLERVGQMAHYALKEMRLLIYQLRPSALEAQGLVGALEQRLEAVERRAGIDARLGGNSGDLPVPARVEEGLYRIAQEILNNVLKHAAATTVQLTLELFDNSIGLSVQDNGQGLDVEAAYQAGGMGLANIQHRVEALGGTLSIDSTLGQGTRVSVRVPATWRPEFGQEGAT